MKTLLMVLGAMLSASVASAQNTNRVPTTMGSPTGSTYSQPFERAPRGPQDIRQQPTPQTSQNLLRSGQQDPNQSNWMQLQERQRQDMLEQQRLQEAMPDGRRFE